MKALASQLMEAISETYDGRLDPRRLSAMGTAAGVLVRLHEAAETEQRIAALESAAASNNGSLTSLVNTYRRPGS
jgi:hypothetical protein